MADEKPQVIVQYITKTDAAPAPGCAEIVVMIIVLAALAMQRLEAAKAAA